MSDSWRLYFEDALAAHRAGQHELASRLVRQHDLTRERPGQRLARAIARALLQEARRATHQQEFYRAWTTLHEARLMAPNGIAFRQERTRLVEKTIQAAEQRVCRGEMPQAKEMLRHFDRFHISEPRAIRLVAAVEQIEQARQLASEGRFGEAVTCLDRAINLSPKLYTYQHQREILNRRKAICQREIEQLRRFLVAEAWDDVRRTAEKLLRIAPALQLARDADQMAVQELSRQAKPQHAELGSLYREQEHDTAALRQGQCALAKFNNPSRHQVGCADAQERHTDRPHKSAPSVVSDRSTNTVTMQDPNSTTPLSSDGIPDDSATPESIQRRFVMWIDGVGGYLICTEDEISLGQALPDGGVDIPVQGDLSRRHLKIHRSPEFDSVEPFGEVQVAGKLITARTILRHDDILEMGRGVIARYRRPHPLSTSAQLELQSRHRTYPWTDGILLMGDSLILGSHRQSHVHCSQWDQELIFFRRHNRLWVRSTSVIEIDGQIHTDAAPLNMSSRIVGQQFAISFERC